MSLLNILLDKVKMADLEEFREKVEAMEKIHDERNREMGLEGISDIIKAREKVNEGIREVDISSVTVYDNEVQQEISKPINQDQPEQQSTEVFEKFLQSIRG